MNDANKELLNKQEERLQEQLIWVAREDIKNLFDSYKQLNAFVNHILILSAGVAGVVIPLLINGNKIRPDLIYLSIFLFVFNIVLGVINMSTFITGLPNALRSITTRQENRLLSFIKEIQEIKLMQDNNAAGERYERLTKKVAQSDDIETRSESKLIRKWVKRFLRFETWFFATFICAVMSLFLSLL